LDNNQIQKSTGATEAQILYANILNAGMLIGFISLITIFILYISGILSPLIPPEKVESYWTLPLHDYLEKSGMEVGWAWFGKLQYGDMLNFVPIAFLSLLTIICYISLIPGLIRKKDTTYTVIAIVEIIVLLVAASGILGTSAH
jgi:phosphoglycerol transferase MdoB-like AlkP superfamily enzyme